MKFTLSAFTLAMVSKAFADETVKLYVQSSNSELSGKGISSIHEGAGINYFFLGSGAQELTYGNSALTSQDTGVPQKFSVDTGYAQLSVADYSGKVTFSSDGALEINGSEDGFYACKNTNDPYRYSTSQYEVMFGNAVGDCTAIKLVKSTGSSSSSSVPSSTKPSATPSPSSGSENVKLYVKSTNSELSGKGIASIHEGAGINYFFLGSDAQELTYTSSALKSTTIGYPQSFSVESGYVQLTVSGSSDVFTFSSDGVLEINGSEDGFYACKNTNDPYRYSTSQYEVMFGKSIGDCTAIKLTKSAGSSSSSTIAPYANFTSTIHTSTDVKTDITTVPCPKCTSTTPTGSVTTVTTVYPDGKTVTTVIPCPTTTATSASTHTPVPTISTKTNVVSCSSCSVSVLQGAANVAKPASFAAFAVGLVALIF